MMPRPLPSCRREDTLPPPRPCSLLPLPPRLLRAHTLSRPRTPTPSRKGHPAFCWPKEGKSRWQGALRTSTASRITIVGTGFSSLPRTMGTGRMSRQKRGILIGAGGHVLLYLTAPWKRPFGLSRHWTSITTCTKAGSCYWPFASASRFRSPSMGRFTYLRPAHRVALAVPLPLRHRRPLALAGLAVPVLALAVREAPAPVPPLLSRGGAGREAGPQQGHSRLHKLPQLPPWRGEPRWGKSPTDGRPRDPHH